MREQGGSGQKGILVKVKNRNTGVGIFSVMVNYREDGAMDWIGTPLTDENGEVLIEGLKSGAYEIQAYKSGYYVATTVVEYDKNFEPLTIVTIYLAANSGGGGGVGSNYTVTIEKVTGGSVRGAGSYASGKTVTLTPMPDVGYNFSHFETSGEYPQQI